MDMPIRTTYARPLAEGYGDAYALAHQQREQVNEQVRLQQVALMNMKNTIQVVLWSKVCLFSNCDAAQFIPQFHGKRAIDSGRVNGFFGQHAHLNTGH